MKKPFKETAVGKFIISKVPQVAQAVGDVLPNSGVLGIVKNIISSTTISEEEKAACLAQLQKFEIEVMQLELEDRKDARDMQKEALKQEDLFAKRFIYFLSGGMIIFSFTYIILASFVTVPPENQSFIHFFSGGLISGSVSLILNFFFGSSLGSKQKEIQLQKSKYE